MACIEKTFTPMHRESNNASSGHPRATPSIRNGFAVCTICRCSTDRSRAGFARGVSFTLAVCGPIVVRYSRDACSACRDSASIRAEDTFSNPMGSRNSVVVPVEMRARTKSTNTGTASPSAKLVIIVLLLSSPFSFEPACVLALRPARTEKMPAPPPTAVTMPGT